MNRVRGQARAFGAALLAAERAGIGGAEDDDCNVVAVGPPFPLPRWLDGESRAAGPNVNRARGQAKGVEPSAEAMGRSGSDDASGSLAIPPQLQEA